MGTYDRGDRPEVHNVIILITDGVSNIDVPSTTREALVAKNKGITVYSIGVTNGVDEEELKAVSTNPQQLGANYFMAADFDTLRDVADTLIKSACRPSYGPYCRETAVAGLQCFCPIDRCDHRPVNGSLCTNVNECDIFNGGCAGTCVDSDGSYFCECPTGLVLHPDLHSCDGVNECLNNPCASGQQCINTYGSYVCVGSGAQRLTGRYASRADDGAHHRSYSRSCARSTLFATLAQERTFIGARIWICIAKHRLFILICNINEPTY